MNSLEEITTPLASNGDNAADHLKRSKGYQWYAFFVTFGGHFMVHFSRKCSSTVKQQLQEEAGYTSLILSEMDTMFMGAYAIGNIMSGKLADSFSPATVISIRFFGSGMCLFLLNASLWFDFVYFSESLANLYILGVYFLFGFFQSIGGPVGTAIVGNWFCDKESIERRELIFGCWTFHELCGDVSAALCTAAVLSSGYAYWWALFIPAVANFAWGLLTITLVADPADAGIKATEGEVVDDSGPAPITYSAALHIPMIAQYTFAFGFFNLTHLVFFFWLPYFLGKHFDPITANLIAAIYSLGMMPGGIIAGIVSDWFGERRATVIGIFMSFLMVFLGIFFQNSESLGETSLIIMLAIMGILVGGTNNIITSIVAVDIASHPSVMASSKSIVTVTGLINGCGAITASIGLLAVGPLQSAFGWSSVWFLLTGCPAVGTLLLSQKIYSEVFPLAVEEPDADVGDVGLSEVS